MATETSSLGDEWQWISNDTAEVLRATVEAAFTADPRKNWSAEEIARWIRDVALVSAKKNDRVKGTVWSSYSDSDQGGDRRFGCTTSRTGIMLCCNGMPYHWRSNKQPSTAMSSAAAEIVAMS